MGINLDKVLSLKLQAQSPVLQEDDYNLSFEVRLDIPVSLKYRLIEEQEQITKRKKVRLGPRWFLRPQLERSILGRTAVDDCHDLLSPRWLQVLVLPAKVSVQALLDQYVAHTSRVRSKKVMAELADGIKVRA